MKISSFEKLITCPYCQKQFNCLYVNTNGDTRERKYCSDVCCKKFIKNIQKQKRAAAKLLRGPTKAEIEKIKIQEQRNLYEALRPTHYTRDELTDQFNISSFDYFKNYYREIYGKELEGIRVSAGRTCIFFPSSIIKDIQNYKNLVLPDGWVDKEYILKILDIHEMTYWEYVKKWGKVPLEKLFFNNKIFLKEEADKWIAKVIEEKNAAKAALRAAREEIKQQRSIEKQKKHELFLQRVAVNKAARQAEKDAAKARKLERKMNPKPKIHKVILNHDTRPDWMIREEKIKRRMRFGPPSYVLSSEYCLTRWNANISLMERGEKGDIQTITCTCCNAVKPYYEFYADYNGSLYGRACRCIACSKIWRKNKPIVKNAKRFATHLTLIIKRDLHIRNNSFQTLINKEIWEALGYTEEQYIEHFLGLMEPWMNWENNRKPKFPGDKTWDVEHIKPKSSFEYKSIHDPQFKEAWALSNMMPMPTKMNAVKSDFVSVNEKIKHLYKKFVINNKPDSNTTWNKYFDFSPLAAREHFEANFCEGMTFDNHGDVWHIDHVIPLAAMPFSSIEDENFKKVWHYTNLSPKFIKDNLAKHSKHENIKYITQKE